MQITNSSLGNYIHFSLKSFLRLTPSKTGWVKSSLFPSSFNVPAERQSPTKSSNKLKEKLLGCPHSAQPVPPCCCHLPTSAIPFVDQIIVCDATTQSNRIHHYQNVFVKVLFSGSKQGQRSQSVRVDIFTPSFQRTLNTETTYTLTP